MPSCPSTPFSPFIPSSPLPPIAVRSKSRPIGTSIDEGSSCELSDARTVARIPPFITGDSSICTERWPAADPDIDFGASFPGRPSCPYFSIWVLSEKYSHLTRLGKGLYRRKTASVQGYLTKPHNIPDHRVVIDGRHLSEDPVARCFEL